MELGMFTEKERIKDKYSEAEDLYEKSNKKFRRLTSGSRGEAIGFEEIEDVRTVFFSWNARFWKFKDCTRKTSSCEA